MACNQTSKCIDVQKFCNGVPDCPDGSDESPTCCNYFSLDIDCYSNNFLKLRASVFSCLVCIDVSLRRLVALVTVHLVRCSTRLIIEHVWMSMNVKCGTSVISYVLMAITRTRVDARPIILFSLWATANI